MMRIPMIRNRSRAKRNRRPKCHVSEESASVARLTSALERLFYAETSLEEYANVEILCACIDYVAEHARWPTPEEIAAITGLSLDQVLETEERLGGTYELALRGGLIEDRR